ncbi:hypothetical protein LK09_12495 [Microbacterium mangrovi]|uniref:Uncharacterized protein n=1 Tax=Microbacterium mangrovi TaxID=1348253 RepID=A0A0B2A663_9MICO|nr:hypothetical protein [Microbacterium mangrovi]KHK97097.1 hypothetical protein LK09_12495 [Microbacterium mangrovi]
MLTITQSRQLSVLVALRDATGDKTRTPVPESAVAALLDHEIDFDGSVSDEVDDLQAQGFALIAGRSPGDREVEMTAHGKIKAEEFDRMRARGTTRPSPPARPEPASRSLAPADPATPAQDAPEPPPLHAALRRAAEPDAGTPENRSAPASAGWRAQAHAVLDAAAQAISQLPPDAESVVRCLVEDARTAVSAGSAPRTRRALTALGGYLADPASGALGNVLAAQMLALAPTLPA